MSDLPPDPIGAGGRSRLYARALSPAARRRAGTMAMQGLGPSPPIDPTARRGMMAQALMQPGSQPQTAPEQPFQPIRSYLGMTPPAEAQAPPTPATVLPNSDPNAPGAEDRISTSIPTAVGSEAQLAPHTRSDLEIGLDAAQRAPDAWKKNADLIRTYDHLDTRGLDDDAVHEKFINHLADNLVWLHNQTDPAIRDSSKRWYDGARAITERWAQQYGKEPRQIAGLLAALSPQKDWFQNVDLAKRLLDLDQRGGNISSTDKMRERLQAYVDATKDEADRAVMAQHVAEIGDKPLGQIKDQFQRAMFMRAYDEAHNARDYRVVTPEGEFGESAKTKGGKNQKVAWGSFKEIHKAMQALSDPDLENISRNMGGNHKVRNFYNNIISPRFGRDVTIDTHAIAAANLIPAGSNHFLVSAGLGLKGSKSAATGSRGLYANYAEAHRRAAERLGILPRELQSITWEGVRGMFLPEQKRNKDFVAANANIWRGHARGDYDAQTARERALAHAAPQGIRDPGWVRRGVEDDA